MYILLKMADKGSESDYSLAVINNIPPDYHSCDLRNYFSQFVESTGFDCFHFRHRPELQTLENSTDQLDRVLDKRELDKKSGANDVKRTTCCVVRLKTSKLHVFMKMYNRRHWTNKAGDVTPLICYICKVKLPKGNEEKQFPQTRGEQKLIPSNRETFTLADLHKLPELHPPDLMPNGNVGTPTMVFMDYIKQCRLPPSIIKKLGLSFPRTRAATKYGSVPFDYGGDTGWEGELDEDYMEVLTGSGHQIILERSDNEEALNENDAETLTVAGHPVVSEKSDIDRAGIWDDRETCDKAHETMKEVTQCAVDTVQNKGKTSRKKKNTWRQDAESKKRMKMGIEEKLIGQSDQSDGDNDSCEEWERHEAMVDDPSNQERNKERLFEEEIELKWEKGGSGLVFYTDAQYWHAQEGDFDEQTADDLNVDMSGYYEEGAGNKDSRDYLTMRQEQRRRNGIEATDRFSAGIASKKHKKSHGEPSGAIGQFETHTRGFGRRILEKQGWSDGQGLGSTVTGIADALDNDGQNPKDKRGFGYRGEKLILRRPAPAQRKVMISTVYDNPAETDPHEPLLRSHEPYHLKYRDEIHFNKSRETLELNKKVE